MLRKRLLLGAIWLMAILVAAQVASAEQIAVQWYSGSSVIPAGQSTGTIRFQVTATGLSSNVYYGYAYKVDNGSWSSVVYPYIGWGIGGSSTQYLDLGLGDGSHTIYVELLSYDGYFWSILTSNSTGQTMYLGVTVQNSYGGGSVTVDGNSVSSGTTFNWHLGQNHTLAATDGATYGGIVQRFDNWSGNGAGAGISVSVTISAASPYTANFHNEYQVSFQNNFPGYGNGGYINVNSTQYSSPTSTFAVAQGYSITGGVTSTTQSFNYIDYTFSNWSPGGSTSASQTFYPSGNTTYTANFTAKPQMVTNMSAGAPVGNYVVVSWTDNPNSDVTQYRIYRKTKHGSDNQVATVNRGVGSWTDWDFVVTGTGSDSMLTYSVYSYYSITGTLSDNASSIVYATFNPSIHRDDFIVFNGKEVPTTYSVGNFPNPFNPSTTISYQIVKNSSVKLDIYDVVGRKVRTLVDGDKSAGYYSVVWNGRDERGRDVSSGTYLYRFTAVPTNGEKAFIQSGKLMFTK